jgi:hypothetical protein
MVGKCSDLTCGGSLYILISAFRNERIVSFEHLLVGLSVTEWVALISVYIIEFKF